MMSDKLIPEPGHRYGRNFPTESEAMQNARQTLPIGEKFALLEFKRESTIPFNPVIHEFAWHWPHDFDFNKMIGVVSVKVHDA